MNRTKSITNDETSSSIRSSDSSNSYQDYLSKIDQQIQSTKDSLQSFDQNPKSYKKTIIFNN